MAITRTTLAADLSVDSNKMSVTSATGFAAGQIVKIDGEYAKIAAVTGTVIKLALRGYDGTAVKAHDILAPVLTTATPSDWTGIQVGADTSRPPFVDGIVSVGENGTIACPTRDTTILLTKATALATTTLADPPKDRDGLRLTVTSATDAAHVITGTFADGTTGSHTTATYQAFNGAAMVLVADAGTWDTVSLVNVAIT